MDHLDGCMDLNERWPLEREWKSEDGIHFRSYSNHQAIFGIEFRYDRFEKTWTGTISFEGFQVTGNVLKARKYDKLDECVEDLRLEMGRILEEWTSVFG